MKINVNFFIEHFYNKKQILIFLFDIQVCIAINNNNNKKFKRINEIYRYYY